MKLLLILCLFLRDGNAQLFNGDNCDNNSGICIPLNKCAPKLLQFQNGIYPDTCGFENEEPLVCCQTKSVSEKHCKQYASAAAAMFAAFEVFAIVGGEATLPKELPHMAALGYSNGNEIIFICGGTLISEQFILTAAHCLSSAQYGAVKMVRLGDINISQKSATSKDYKVKSRIRHPSYLYPAAYNDIALLELENKVQFNNFIRPACLYTNKEIPPDMELIASGWGLTQSGGNLSDTLLKVNLDLFTDKECKDKFKHESVRKLKYGILTESQFCSGGKTNERDTCQGDSGGPLQTYISTERIYSVVGITSFGKVCGVANIPAVYTRVSYFIPWIESIVWPQEY